MRVALGVVTLLLGAACVAVAGGDVRAASGEVERVPHHVLTWYYYGLNDVNANVPPRTMAAYADFVEDDGYTAPHAEAFKRAGGRFAGAYTDPAYVPYCSPPFGVPNGGCGGPIGNLVSHDESAWFHGPDGARVHRADGKYYQDALNPAAASARAAYRKATGAILAKAPSLDLFFADDYGGPWRHGNNSPKDAWFYDFNDPGVEIRDDATFVRAAAAMLGSAARPVIVNGADPETGAPAYGGAYLLAPRVWGAAHEGCFRNGDRVLTDAKDAWRSEEDSLLAVSLLQRYTVCFMMGTPTPANRTYALASWWITYDPRWSVAAPIDPVPNASAILPEYDIVPRAPLRTAARTVRELRDGGGAYVREFGACYQAGRAIGPCAAVVNPTANALAVPRLHERYGAALVLDARDALSGGTASWRRGPPGEVGAGNALVLKR